MENQKESTRKGDATVENALQEIDLNAGPGVGSVSSVAKANETPQEGEEFEGGENIEPVLSDEDEEVADQKDGKPASANVGQVQKKKKSKKKSKSKRGLARPTGFEEFYVDAPLTPDEYEEERHLYSVSLPFTERVQTAIQRYFAKRNLNSARKEAFDKYMVYGGVESGQKMFSGGLDANTTSNMNAAEIRDFTATHFVPHNRGGPDDPEFVVDFEGCAKGFFSSYIPMILDLMSEDRIGPCTSTISNFLNYIVYHNVCPEYIDDVNAARAVCKLAEKELTSIARVYGLLPGSFNQACSSIFGGMYQHSYIGNQDWADDLQIYKGMSPDVARKTFKIGMAAHSSQEMFERYKIQSPSHTISITNTITTGLEVTEIILADREVLKLYQRKVAEGLKALGKMKARTWFSPLAPEEDLTEEEEAAAAAGTDPPAIIEYEFWVEDELLQRCFVGMKLETTVHRLSFGLDFFDSVTGVYCSFYSSLPNEAMVGWREPGPRLPMREKVVDGAENAGAAGEDFEDDG